MPPAEWPEHLRHLQLGPYRVRSCAGSYLADRAHPRGDASSTARFITALKTSDAGCESSVGALLAGSGHSPGGYGAYSRTGLGWTRDLVEGLELAATTIDR